MTRLATLLSVPLLVGGAALAILGLAIHVAAYVSEVRQWVLSFAMTMGFGVGLLAAPGGWVLQGGRSAYLNPEGWGAFRGWSRRASVAIGLAIAFLMVNFIAMMLLPTPEAVARQIGAVTGVMGIFATAGAWFQMTTPTDRWMRTCQSGHRTASFRNRCGRCGEVFVACAA